MYCLPSFPSEEIIWEFTDVESLTFLAVGVGAFSVVKVDVVARVLTATTSSKYIKSSLEFGFDVGEIMVYCALGSIDDKDNCNSDANEISITICSFILAHSKQK